MPNPQFLPIAAALDVLGIISLLVTHFGLVAGGLIVGPAFFAGAVVMYICVVVIPPPPVMVLLFIGLFSLFLGIFYFHWWGISTGL